jgi:hypothetical protein
VRRDWKVSGCDMDYLDQKLLDETMREKAGRKDKEEAL